MKKLNYIFPILLILLLYAALPFPAGAASFGWSYEDGSAQGVTLSSDGDDLLVTLNRAGEYTIWLVSADEDFENPIYMVQHAGTDPVTIRLSEAALSAIAGQDLALYVYGENFELRLRVSYGTAEIPPSPSPTPSPSPSPSVPPSPGGGSVPTPTTPPGGGSDGESTPTPTTPNPAPGSEVPQFTDTAGHWGEAYIAEAAARGLFSGYDDGSFGPDVPITRAQFITVLWRMAGRPAAAGTPFTDIGGESAEFRSAIAWGYRRNYIDGVDADRFAPSGLLTREQAMKILYYFAGGVSGGESELYDVYDRGYTDSGAISSWAKAPMYWGVYHRIISGVGDGLLAPQGTATRAQIAKILIIYMDDMA